MCDPHRTYELHLVLSKAKGPNLVRQLPLIFKSISNRTKWFCHVAAKYQIKHTVGQKRFSVTTWLETCYYTKNIFVNKYTIKYAKMCPIPQPLFPPSSSIWSTSHPYHSQPHPYSSIHLYNPPPIHINHPLYREEVEAHNTQPFTYLESSTPT